MGGLWRLIPITYALMWIGTLALAGIGIPGMFGFAGFYSKDIILEAAWACAQRRRPVRLLARHRRRVDDRLLFLAPDVHDLPRRAARRPRDAAPRPRIALGHAGPADRAGDRRDVRRHARLRLLRRRRHGGTSGAKSLLVLEGHNTHRGGASRAALGQAGAAGRRPRSASRSPTSSTSAIPGCRGQARRAGSAALYLFLLNKWYFDELYDCAVRAAGACRSATASGRRGDGAVIDGVGPDGIAAATRDLARRAGRLQTGYVYHYAFAMLIGVVALVTWYLFVRAR